MPTPWFFKHLGITPTKDVKAIKRAYAVALKNTDQQNEREAFETLRTAYEQALAWAADPMEEEELEDEWEEEDEDDLRIDSGPLPPFPAHDDAHLKSPAPPGPDRDAYMDRDDDDGPPSGPPPLAPAPPPSAFGTADPARPESPAPAAQPEDLAARNTAIQEWLARLLDASGPSLDILLDEALKDPRLAHLDSQSQLEAHIADALYRHPEGRVALFDAASLRFGWADRNARFMGGTAAAHWIFRVINQDLQWREQGRAIVALQNAAVRAAASTHSPGKWQAYRFTPTLEVLNEKFPEWLALRLPEGRLQAWLDARARLSKGWLRIARIRNYYTGDKRKMPGRVVVAVFLILMVHGIARALFNGAFPSPDASATSQVQVPAPDAAAAAAAAPVLAYEFTGAVTKDSCESAHEFIHESNWLEVDDPSAIALLTTRVFLCEQLKQWPQAADPLVSCLRDERLAAMSAGRPEDARHCAVKTTAKK